jgi:hypothetical protein
MGGDITVLKAMNGGGVHPTNHNCNTQELKRFPLRHKNREYPRRPRNGWGLDLY